MQWSPAMSPCISRPPRAARRWPLRSAAPTARVDVMARRPDGRAEPSGRSDGFAGRGWRLRAWREAAMVVEVCWRAAEGRTSGEFFESTVRPDGTVAAVLGDAPGFGPAAAPVAARLAQAARAALRDRRRPFHVLAALDAEAQSAGPEVVATALCVVMDPTSGTAELSSAGHLPAVLVRPSGAQRID